MWQYRVTRLPGWRMSTYQPHPDTDSEPSWSHGDGCPFGGALPPSTLHNTVTTTPAAAARITVPRATARSIPSWVGRCGVRNPDTRLAPDTGSTQPPATGWHTGSVPPV